MSTRIATAASPAPRKTAFWRNSSSTVALPASISVVNPLPERTTLSVAPMSRKSAGAKGAANIAIAAAISSPSTIDCPAARAAPSSSCSPVRRATSAVAPIDSPSAAV